MPKKTKRTCRRCEDRPALHRSNGRILWDRQHDLCFRCFRSVNDRVRAVLLRFNARPVEAPAQLRRIAMWFAVVAIAAAAQAASVWAPPPPPASCTEVHAQCLVLDVSKSMLKHDLFGRAQAEVAEFLDQAPPCSYVILAQFGTTADVVADGFITGLPDRERLKAAALSMKATHIDTNPDEAAKLVEWVQMKVRDAFADSPWGLSVTVLSDWIADPSAGKHDFDLKRFLEELPVSEQRQVMGVALTAGGAAPEMPALDRGYVLIKAPVSALGQILHHAAASVPVIAPEPPPDPAAEAVAANESPTPMAVTASTNDPEEAPMPEAAGSSWSDARLIAAVVAALLGGLVVTILSMRRREADPTAPDSSDEPLVLDVTEHPSDGERNEHSRPRRQTVAVSENAPIVFGSDPVMATVIVPPVDGIPSEALFQVVPISGRRLRLSPASPSVEVTCDGRRLTRRGIVRRADAPVRVRVADREWSMSLVPARRGATRSQELLARIDLKRREPATTSAERGDNGHA